MFVGAEAVAPKTTRSRTALPVQASTQTDRCIETPQSGRIRFRVLGQSGMPLIAILGGISADRRIDHWWGNCLGRHTALNPDRFRLVGIDWLECVPHRGSVSTHDQAAALCGVLDALREPAFTAVVGSSFGAMVGLAFAESHPERLDHLVAISGAHRSTASASASRVIQRAIIRAMREAGKAEQGLALARALALIGYRPDALLDQRFHDPDPARLTDQLQSYLEYNGRRFADRFGVDRYLALSEAIDHHWVSPERIRCPVDLVGADSDTLVPLAQLRGLAGAIGLRARLHRIDSAFGHDAFLKSPERINPLLKRIFRDRVEVRHAV